MGASIPLSITLVNCGRLMHLAIAYRRVWLLNGSASVLSMTHCTVG